MCIKGFINHLSHIDHDVSTAYCMSSSGDSVVQLSRTICTQAMDVSGWCITNLVHGWWLRSKAFLALEEETVPLC